MAIPLGFRNLHEIATPVCALARNDVEILAVVAINDHLSGILELQILDVGEHGGFVDDGGVQFLLFLQATQVRGHGDGS